MISFYQMLILLQLLDRIGFVAQDDVLFPQLTVEETLVFSAFLRLPTEMSRKEKYLRVDRIIKELSLERSVSVFAMVTYMCKQPI